MSNNYIPTTWVGGKTVGTADVMNNIEQGIVGAHDRLDDTLNKIVDNAKELYIAPFFDSDNGTKTYLYKSFDGVNFKRIDEMMSIRDGDIIYYKGKFYCLATQSTNPYNDFRIFISDNLVDWEENIVNLGLRDGINQKVYAPEWVLDGDKIYIALSKQVGVMTDSVNSTQYADFRPYLITVDDLASLTFSEIKKIELTNENRIDPHIYKHEETYYLYIKKERNENNLKDGAIEIWTSSNLVDWTIQTNSITSLNGYRFESPCIEKINDKYYLYVDNYGGDLGSYMFYCTSTDLLNWDEPKPILSKHPTRHGTVRKITDVKAIKLFNTLEVKDNSTKILSMNTTYCQNKFIEIFKIHLKDNYKSVEMQFKITDIQNCHFDFDVNLNIRRGNNVLTPTFKITNNIIANDNNNRIVLVDNGDNTMSLLYKTLTLGSCTPCFNLLSINGFAYNIYFTNKVLDSIPSGQQYSPSYLYPFNSGWWVDLNSLAVGGVINDLKVEHGKVYAITSGNVTINSVSFADNPSNPYCNPYKIYFSIFNSSTSGCSITLKKTSGSKLIPPLAKDFVITATDYADKMIKFINPLGGNDYLRMLV